MNYAVIDTESNGLFGYSKPADAPGQPRMAALGLILVNEALEIEAEHDFLIRPDGWTFDNTSDAAKVNGLTHELLMAEGIDVREALRLYGEAIDQRRIIAGFNVPHDIKQLRAELRYVGYPDRFMQTRTICAMQGCRQIVDARTADGRKKAPKLEEAVKHFGIEVPGGIHSALPDAHKALEILRKLREAGEFPSYSDPYDKPAKKQPAPRPGPLLQDGRPDAEQKMPGFPGRNTGGIEK